MIDDSSVRNISYQILSGFEPASIFSIKLLFKRKIYLQIFKNHENLQKFKNSSA